MEDRENLTWIHVVNAAFPNTAGGYISTQINIPYGVPQKVRVLALTCDSNCTTSGVLVTDMVQEPVFGIVAANLFSSVGTNIGTLDTYYCTTLGYSSTFLGTAYTLNLNNFINNKNYIFQYVTISAGGVRTSVTSAGNIQMILEFFDFKPNPTAHLSASRIV
jgi:hypothetical protein